MQKLNDDFKKRESFFSNRSSCIFPIYFDGPENDLFIVFLNYWTLKNELDSAKLSVNYRIYDGDGDLLLRKNLPINAWHNQQSVKGLLEEAKYQNSDTLSGMIEVEVVSVENLRFSFPGITGIYRAGNLYSSVHAGGRIKNSDENQDPFEIVETNWTCKWGQGISPFFHYFNGPNKPQNKSLEVSILGLDGELLDSMSVDVSQLPPFGSRVYFVNEIFQGKIFDNDAFVCVKLEGGSKFPRMIVGNYHKSRKFMEVTHSFSLIDKADYCPTGVGIEFESMLCCLGPDKLNLRVHVFPTNGLAKFGLQTYAQDECEQRLTPVMSDVVPFKYEYGAMDFHIKAKTRFMCCRLTGGMVPSRLNASFIYTVANKQSSFSTDIASGAKSSVYPPKYNHWGQAYLSEDYDTVIMIRNNSHRPSETNVGNCQLKIFGSSSVFEFEFLINAESSRFISLRDLISLRLSEFNLQAKFLSWFLITDVPTCETFWISFREEDGAIFGEHGF
jgi:hypothetical protein